MAPENGVIFLPTLKMSTFVKPFQRKYAINATFMQMRKAVDTSIRITSSRISEYDSNQEVSKEIFVTLSELNKLRNDLDEMQKRLLQNV